MKKNYVTFISLLIIAAAAVIYAVSNRDTRPAAQSLHAYVNPADLKSVIIARAQDSIELVPQGASWFLRESDLLIPVDAAAMLKLLEFINTAAIVQRATSNPDTWPRFDLSEEGALTITLQTGAGSSTVYVGKPKDNASQFVRLPGDPAVYLVSNTLDTGTEPWRWHYRKILQYAPELLAAIDYGCTQTTIRLQRDDASGILRPHNAPAGKLPADTGKLTEAFRDLSVGEYVPREQAPTGEALVTHTLHFTDGSSAALRFFERDDESDRPPFLDIVFGASEPADEQLRHARDLCARYVFSLSWIDAAKYRKSCEEFFIDPPPAQPADQDGDTPENE